MICSQANFLNINCPVNKWILYTVFWSILIFFKKNLFIVSDADGYKGGKVKIEMFPFKKKLGYVVLNIVVF